MSDGVGPLGETLTIPNLDGFGEALGSLGGMIGDAGGAAGDGIGAVGSAVGHGIGGLSSR